MKEYQKIFKDFQKDSNEIGRELTALVRMMHTANNDRQLLSDKSLTERIDKIEILALKCRERYKRGVLNLPIYYIVFPFKMYGIIRTFRYFKRLTDYMDLLRMERLFWHVHEEIRLEEIK